MMPGRCEIEGGPRGEESSRLMILINVSSYHRYHTRDDSVLHHSRDTDHSFDISRHFWDTVRSDRVRSNALIGVHMNCFF